ncbi:MAG TPA: phosphate ABC transporter substrate-binding protein [Prosthecobacter sp.]|nr:phosphate ABC transporter substrate-binding protein [Prosthecobacter sp.]
MDEVSAQRRLKLAIGVALLMLPLGATAQTDPFRAKTVGLWFMGQSLGEGSESLPLVTPVDTGWGNYAFKRGVRTWLAGDHARDPAKRPQTDFTFVPLVAASNGGLGETIANGLADHLKATLLRTAQPRAVAPHFLAAYAGQGGRMIEELSAADEAADPRTPPVKQGGGYYQTSLDDARRAVQQAKSARQDFAIAALVWMQGEANGGPTGGIVPSRWDPELPSPAGQDWYRDRLMAYRKKWSADLTAITQQRGEIPMFTYQTLGPAGEAQLMAADADHHLYLAGPHYAVASALNSRTTQGRYGAAIHLSADGERWFGEQVAKVIRRVLVEAEDWQPLRPRKAWIEDSGSSVIIEFTVPRPPLILDDKFLPLQQSPLAEGFSTLAGFRLHDGAGAVALIRAVEVASATRFRIRLVSPLKADRPYSISYGSSFCSHLGAIASIRKGSDISGQPTTELVIKPKPPQPLLDEGAFYVMNTAGGAALAQAPIRQVRTEGETSVLRFENRELRGGVPFVEGQTINALRPFSYGNLRDSDSEAAIFSFADSAYGTRAGQPYPLWNWCVLFSGFPVTPHP